MVCVLGLFVAIWARRTLAGNWSSDVTFKRDHELIQTGPYRYAPASHLQGLLLMALGTALAGGQLRAWLGLLLLFGRGCGLNSRRRKRSCSGIFPTLILPIKSV